MTTITAAQRGDQEAFAEIVVQFQGMAHGIAYQYVGDAHLAEDVAQEAFIEAYLCLPHLRAPLAFPAWFRRIIIKRADRVTRRSAAPTLPLATAAALSCEAPGPPEAAEQRELSQVMREALALLPARDQQALSLFYLHGSSVQEIASAIGKPAATVKKRLFDARRRLRRIVEGVDGGASPAGAARPQAAFSQAVQFFLAVRTGDTRRAAALLEREPALVRARELPAPVEARLVSPPGSSFTALHRATSSGHMAMIELLLARGADTEARTRNHETALHLAVLYDRPAAAARLLQARADPNAATELGMTALHWAVVQQRRSLAALLIAAGARTDVADRYGRTALDWAILKGDEDAVMLMRGTAARTSH